MSGGHGHGPKGFGGILFMIVFLILIMSVFHTFKSGYGGYHQTGFIWERD